MKTLFNQIRPIPNVLLNKFTSKVSRQSSPLTCLFGIILWLSASFNIVLCIIYLLRSVEFGSFVSITLLISFFYLAFTSLASNFEISSRKEQHFMEYDV
ncbi:MAG: hypothetical protein HQK84_12865 [Nitrospinae bacterium]|nr:hypothetical protein [Nitrospinota bacterium]